MPYATLVGGGAAAAGIILSGALGTAPTVSGTGVVLASGGVLAAGPLPLNGGSAYLSGQLPAADIAPASTNGYVLTTVGGVATWAAASGGSGITQLTGDVTAGPGSGSVAATVQRVNGSSVPVGGALTVGQVLQATGAAALGYGALNLSTAASVTGALPIVNLATGAAGQILMANSTPANAWTTLSQDGTLSAAGALTVTQARAGLYAFPATTGLVTLAAVATTPGLVQTSAASDVVTATTTIAAQAAYASAATNVTGGKLVLIDGAGATTGGINGGVDVCLQGQTYSSTILAHPFRAIAGTESGGTPFFAVSSVNSNTSGLGALWLGTYAASPTLSTASLYVGAGSFQITHPANVQIEYAGNNRLTIDSTGSYGASSTNVGVNGSLSVGGGSGVLGIKNATTQPSTLLSGGVVLAALSGALAVYDTSAAGANITVNSFGFVSSANAASGGSISWSQSPNSTANATATAMGLYAQNATGSGATTGGALNLGSGSGATSGAINLQPGGSVTALSVTTSGSGNAATFSSAAAASISIASTSAAAAAGKNLTVAAQNSTGTGATTGGSLLLYYGTGATDGDILIGASGSSHQAITVSDVSSTYTVLIGGLLGGGDSISNAPLQFAQSTIATGSGGTVTPTAVQLQCPKLVVSGATLTSNAILDFTANAGSASGAVFFLDCTGVNGGAALGAFSLSFKNGTATQTLTSLPTGGLVTVTISGANKIAVG